MVAASCGSSTTGSATGADGGVDGSTTPVVPDNPQVGQTQPAPTDPAATNPKDDGGGQPGWTLAPPMGAVTYVANRDSAILVVPDVAGVIDYRIFAIPAGIGVAADGAGEKVTGGTIYCAGYKQHAAPHGPLELLRQIEVSGLTGPTRVVVEALDTACPFTGVRGPKHGDISMAKNPDFPTAPPWSVWTEDEIRQKYGSLIINGHGPASQALQRDPTPALGQPAPPSSPKVLARTTVTITPLGYSGATTAFFDDFKDNDQPHVIGKYTTDRAYGTIYQNTNWTIYGNNEDTGSSPFIDRGQLRMLLVDLGADVMASYVAIPKKTVTPTLTDYLHVTFEVATNASQRRYWWISLCGADQPGKTLNADGTINGAEAGSYVQTPFFMDDDGRNPSVDAWNCLQVFPRDGYAFPLPPDNTNPQTELRVIVNKADQGERDSVVNPCPDFFYPKGIGPPSWYRQIDAKGNAVATMLDDLQTVSPRTHYDLYIRRDRVILYVNGQQRVCNDFKNSALTMPEAFLGYGQVLYHSSAEHSEYFDSFWVRDGQRYYIQNTPFVDDRTWDNLGYTEHVGAPAGLDESRCWEFTGSGPAATDAGAD
jgi:hypothetical protein